MADMRQAVIGLNRHGFDLNSKGASSDRRWIRIVKQTFGSGRPMQVRGKVRENHFAENWSRDGRCQTTAKIV